MASATPHEDLQSFHEHVLKSKRIMAFCGDGLAAASGVPNFKGPEPLWRDHRIKTLATPSGWVKDRVIVWQFYNERRHLALGVKPNAAHLALSALARQHPNFQCLTRNIDDLSRRAGHPKAQLQLLNGSLFNVKCDAETVHEYRYELWDASSDDGTDLCTYKTEDYNDPFCPAFASSDTNVERTNEEIQSATTESDLNDTEVSPPSVSISDLPRCPRCQEGYLRPDVALYNEATSKETTRICEQFIDSEPVDLILIVGTSSMIYPIGGYIGQARTKGTRVAVVNTDAKGARKMRKRDGHQQDWFFVGDLTRIIPELLRPIIGDISTPSE